MCQPLLWIYLQLHFLYVYWLNDKDIVDVLEILAV